MRSYCNNPRLGYIILSVENQIRQTHLCIPSIHPLQFCLLSNPILQQGMMHSSICNNLI